MVEPGIFFFTSLFIALFVLHSGIHRINLPIHRRASRSFCLSLCHSLSPPILIHTEALQPVCVPVTLRSGPCWKMWKASRYCVSSLRRGHANLLCIVPILVYVPPKRVHANRTRDLTISSQRPWPLDHEAGLSQKYNISYSSYPPSGPHRACNGITLPSSLYTRSVRKVSSHFEYLENRLRGLDVTWQPVRGDLTVHLWTVNLSWG